MRLAIMQPYLFPYLGYFQLIAAVDRFVFYDDVSYIRQGWINRNRILVNGKPGYFTVPIEDASSFVSIAQTRVHAGSYSRWRGKFLKTLQLNYRRAPACGEVLALVERTLRGGYSHIGELARASVLNVLEYLSLRRDIVESSSRYANRHLEGTARVLDICGQAGARAYVNLPGGRGLYSAEDFRSHGIELRFIQPQLKAYLQHVPGFVPGLSVLDALMFNGAEKVANLLEGYTLE